MCTHVNPGCAWCAHSVTARGRRVSGSTPPCDCAPRRSAAIRRRILPRPAHEIAAVRLHQRQLTRLARRSPACEGALDVGRQLLGLPPLARRMPLLELRHDARREQLERRADVLVPVVAALLDEDGLVDARLLELAHGVAYLLRRADAAAPAWQRDLIPAEELPH